VWHDGAPFTADDVIFNWTFSIDPANVTSSRGAFEEVSRVDKLDRHTVKVVYKKPQPFWASVFTGGGLLPRHVFEPLKGAASRDAIGMVKPVGTGPYKLTEFKPGDVIRADINPTYHVANRPYFDRLDIKCGGDSPSSVRAVMQTGEYDFAYYVLMEEDMLKRIEQGPVKGRILTIPSSGVSFIQVNQSDPWTEVDGERSSARSVNPLLGDPAVRGALAALMDRRALQEQIFGRVARVTGSFLNAPARFRSSLPAGEPSVEAAAQALEAAGYRRGADGIRARDGRRLKLVFQAPTGGPIQKAQAVIKSACARAGIELELKSVVPSAYFSGDPANPDTFSRFSADLQIFTTLGGVDPQGLMAQLVSWEIAARANQWSGRNVSRWKSDEYDRLWRAAETELDPAARATLFVRMNDLAVQRVAVIPLLWRGIAHGVGNRLSGVEANPWDSILARLPYWQREA
jgi:peptide/nickel transport system substrate-binding protein